MGSNAAWTAVRSSSKAFSSPLKNSRRCPGCGSPVAARPFATSARRETKLRKDMWEWVNGPGAVFRHPVQGATNYLSAYDKYGNLKNRKRQEAQDGDGKEEQEEDSKENQLEDPDDEGVKAKKELPSQTKQDLKPFPLNPFFTSPAVMSEELKDEVYKRVVVRKQTLREVSVALGVEIRRVAACARMKTIENNWKQEGKPLANTYADAITGMLPQTTYDRQKPQRHESINDLPVHPYTDNQLFHPTSESRHFTRADAGRIFNNRLLPADARIPHPAMVEDAARRLEGVPEGARRDALRKTFAEEHAQRTEQSQKKAALEAKRTTIVKSRTGGAEFRFQEISAEVVGKDPKSPLGVGWRYGVPHNDRKRAVHKIQTTVE